MGDSILCGIGIDLRKAGDVVECIKQEMGIDLIFQPGELCLCVLGLFVLQLLAYLTGTDEMADADGDGRHHAVEQQEHQEAGEEAYPHVGCHLRHIGDVMAMDEHPDEL